MNKNIEEMKLRALRLQSIQILNILNEEAPPSVRFRTAAIKDDPTAIAYFADDGTINHASHNDEGPKYTIALISAPDGGFSAKFAHGGIVQYHLPHLPGPFDVDFPGDVKEDVKHWAKYLLEGKPPYDEKFDSVEFGGILNKKNQRWLTGEVEQKPVELLSHIQKQMSVLLNGIIELVPPGRDIRVTATPLSPVKYVINLFFSEKYIDPKSPFSIEIISLGTEDGAFKMRFLNRDDDVYVGYRQTYNEGDEPLTPRKIITFLIDGVVLTKADPASLEALIPEPEVEMVTIPKVLTFEMYKKISEVIGHDDAPFITARQNPATQKYEVLSIAGDVDMNPTVLHTVDTEEEAEELSEFEQISQGYKAFILGAQEAMKTQPQ